MDMEWEIQEFKTGPINISYPKSYYPFIRECLIYDVYRTNLLQEGDIVVDLGAAVGEFTILASKKVGRDGVIFAIEPNPNDFEILEQNIHKNGCNNVMLINKGVASITTEKRISFWGRNFKAQLDTLGNILNEVGLDKDINFVKMDIEGYEADVVRNDIDIIKKANVISAELHNTRDEIDSILGSYGFIFNPLTKYHCIKNLVRNTLFSHPYHFLRIISNTMLLDRRVFLLNPHFATGSYLRGDLMASKNQHFVDGFK